MDGKIRQNECGRLLPVVRRDSNIPLVSLENYEVVSKEFFYRHQRKEGWQRKPQRKEGDKKE